MDASRKALRTQVQQLSDDCGLLRRLVDKNANKVMDLQRERDMLTKTGLKQNERAEAQAHLVRAHEHVGQQLSKDIVRWKTHLRRALARYQQISDQNAKVSTDLANMITKRKTAETVLKAKENTSQQVSVRDNYVKKCVCVCVCASVCVCVCVCVCV